MSKALFLMLALALLLQGTRGGGECSEAGVRQWLPSLAAWAVPVSRVGRIQSCLPACCAAAVAVP